MQSIPQFLKRISAAAVALILVVSMMAVNVSAESPVAVGVDFPCETDTFENWPEGPWISAKTACLMDMDSGAVLYGKGAQAAEYPASITKIMTAVVVLLHCDDLSQIVTMTETGLADAYGDSSNIVPTLGEQFTVEQCLQMLLVKSANDIASQLAEFTCGSVEAFADEMNRVAELLGCQSTHFSNASGLHADDHYTSAYDMCLITKYALTFDKFREIFGMELIEIPATQYSEARYYDTHVYLMWQDGNYYYDGILGGKTGFTEEALSTLVCAVERDGQTLIGAVLGAPETESNAKDMVNLFNYGLTYFNDVDRSRGPYMFAETVTEEEIQARQNSEAATMTAEEIAETVTEKTVTSATPVVTQASEEPKEQVAEAEPVEIKKEDKKSGNVKIYVIILVVVLLIIALLVGFEIRAAQIRKRRRRRRKRRPRE